MSLGKMNTPQEVAHSCEILSQTLTERKKKYSHYKITSLVAAGREFGTGL